MQSVQSAGAQGVCGVTLYSRQTRTRAHRFYERHGYRVTTEAFSFEKDLGAEG